MKVRHRKCSLRTHTLGGQRWDHHRRALFRESTSCWPQDSLVLEGSRSHLEIFPCHMAVVAWLHILHLLVVRLTRMYINTWSIKNAQAIEHELPEDQ